jgi:hypothetical protein
VTTNIVDGGAGPGTYTGPGTDNTISYASAPSGVDVSLLLQGQPQGTAGTGIQTLSNFQNITGSPYGDMLQGDGGNNVLDGGGGVNTVSYSGASAGVTVSLALQGGPQDTGGSGIDTLINFQNLIGSAYDDTLEGDAGNNVLNGGGGVNTVSYAHATAGVTVDLGNNAAQNTVGAGIDTLSNFQKIIGSAFNDTLIAAGNTISILAGAGDDVIEASGLPAGGLIDGGPGINTLIAVNGGDFSQGTLTGIEKLTFTPMLFGLSVLPLVVVLSAAEAAWPLVVTGATSYFNHLVIDGAAGVPVDLSGWTFSNWQRTSQVIYTGSSGADLLTIDPSASAYSITLGGGSDTLVLSAAHANATPGVELRDFQAGAGGDVLNLTPYLGGLANYPAGADPFAGGFLRLIQSGANTLVQVDAAGGGQSFVTLMTLDGVVGANITAANLGGLTSNLASPIQVGTSGPDVFQAGVGSARIDGAGGLDTVVYSSLLRAYAPLLVNGATTVVSGGPEVGTGTLANISRVQFVDGYLATSTTDLAAQVYRLYEAALGRAPDPEGLANWTHALAAGQALASVAGGFVNSLEFQAEYGSLNNPGYIALLYQNVLGRPYDAAGLANWNAALDSGQSRAQVLIGFSESAEFISKTASAVHQGLWVQDAGAAEVARLYDTVFGRLPDVQGETNWTHMLDNGVSTPLQVTQGFVGSAEFQATYGSLDDSHFVQLLYQNALHRPADAGGLANWTAYLATGHSRAEVVLGFSESPEHIANTAAHIDQGVWFTT